MLSLPPSPPFHNNHVTSLPAPKQRSRWHTPHQRSNRCWASIGWWIIMRYYLDQRRIQGFVIYSASSPHVNWIRGLELLLFFCCCFCLASESNSIRTTNEFIGESSLPQMHGKLNIKRFLRFRINQCFARSVFPSLSLSVCSASVVMNRHLCYYFALS